MSPPKQAKIQNLQNFLNLRY